MASKQVVPKCGWCGSRKGRVNVASNGAIFRCAKCGAPTATQAPEGDYQ